jgi:hypothetical protein
VICSVEIGNNDRITRSSAWSIRVVNKSNSSNPYHVYSHAPLSCDNMFVWLVTRQLYWNEFTCLSKIFTAPFDTERFRFVLKSSLTVQCYRIDAGEEGPIHTRCVSNHLFKYSSKSTFVFESTTLLCKWIIVLPPSWERTRMLRPKLNFVKTKNLTSRSSESCDYRNL